MTIANQLEPGALVLLSLGSPREKFWGMLLELAPAGISLRGLDLNSFDDTVALVRNGEAAGAAVLFFPMHRVERMELDEPNGEIPSLAQRFASASGKPVSVLFPNPSRSVPAR